MLRSPPPGPGALRGHQRAEQSRGGRVTGFSATGGHDVSFHFLINFLLCSSGLKRGRVGRENEKLEDCGLPCARLSSPRAALSSRARLNPPQHAECCFLSRAAVCSVDPPTPPGGRSCVCSLEAIESMLVYLSNVPESHSAREHRGSPKRHFLSRTQPGGVPFRLLLPRSAAAEIQLGSSAAARPSSPGSGVQTWRGPWAAPSLAITLLCLSERRLGGLWLLHPYSLTTETSPGPPPRGPRCTVEAGGGPAGRWARGRLQ